MKSCCEHPLYLFRYNKDYLPAGDFGQVYDNRLPAALEEYEPDSGRDSAGYELRRKQDMNALKKAQMRDWNFPTGGCFFQWTQDMKFKEEAICG